MSELDAKLAALLFGWAPDEPGSTIYVRDKGIPRDCGGPVFDWFDCGGPVTGIPAEARASECWEGAGLVIEAMRERVPCYRVAIDCDGPGFWTCYFESAGYSGRAEQCHTAPEAVAEAALAALEKEATDE